MLAGTGLVAVVVVLAVISTLVSTSRAASNSLSDFTSIANCAPLLVTVSTGSGYTATCSGDSSVCKGFKPTVSGQMLQIGLQVGWMGQIPGLPVVSQPRCAAPALDCL